MLLKVTSLILRVSSLTAKLGVLFYLAKALSSEDFVTFGIFTVTIVYLQYVIGLDIYNFANRKIALNRSNRQLFETISKQYSFYFCLYLVVAIISLLLWILSHYCDFVLPSWYFLSIFILISEHFFNEIYRLFNFMLQPIFAAFLYFMKSVIFFMLICVSDYVTANISDIESVLTFWLIVNISVILVGMLKFNIIYIVSKLWNIDRKWLRVAVKFSLPLLLSALCSKAVFTFDRSVASAFLDIESAASYVLIMSIFFALNSVLDSVFFVFKVPLLISSFNSDFKEQFNTFKRSALYLIVLGSLSFIPGFYITQIVFSDKIDYNSQIAFYMVSMVFFLFNLSQIYHFAIYAYGASKAILSTQFYALIMTLLMFSTGIFLDIAITIEFIISCVGIYCFSAAILKRKVYMQLSKVEENAK